MRGLGLLVLQLSSANSIRSLLQASNGFETSAFTVDENQGLLDMKALTITYNSDLYKQLNPGLFATDVSTDILELHNGAEYAMYNAQHTSKYQIVAYLCFLEPSTEGCDNFNELGCAAIGSECQSLAAEKRTEMTSLCTETDAETAEKAVDEKCFIVTLRETNDGASDDILAPWNDKVEEWFDRRNCTSLMYHLKYRCHANLIKWNEQTATNEFVDLDALFDAAFGITALSEINAGSNEIECSSLNVNDKQSLAHSAMLHAETAILNFVSTAGALARSNLAAADVLFRQKGSTISPTPQYDVQRKLRSTLLINLFYDGAVLPFEEVCCALNMCYDYHPMNVVMDKATAEATFYPGGLQSLINSGHTAPYVDDTFGTALDKYLFNTLSNAPKNLAWQAASGAEITDIESF